MGLNKAFFIINTKFILINNPFKRDLSTLHINDLASILNHTHVFHKLHHFSLSIWVLDLNKNKTKRKQNDVHNLIGMKKSKRRKIYISQKR